MTGIFDRLAISALPLLPRPLVRGFALRYIAGETLAEALDRLRALRAEGFDGIVDILGEDLDAEEEARGVLEAYREAASAVNEGGLDAYVSVKPTHFGLRLSEGLALELFRELVRHCQELGVFVRVEMEDHETTDATLRIFEQLRTLTEDVGIVLQARLLRTPDDIARLAPGPLSVRMCKGIYLEPASIAHVDAEPIREAFLRCTERLFDRGAFVALATHDEVLAQRLLDACRERDLAEDRYEFEVLLGVRPQLWRIWQSAGERVRVYVPFGPDWRAYSTRRMKKNPQVFRHLVRNFFSRR